MMKPFEFYCNTENDDTTNANNAYNDALETLKTDDYSSLHEFWRISFEDASKASSRVLLSFMRATQPHYIRHELVTIVKALLESRKENVSVLMRGLI